MFYKILLFIIYSTGSIQPLYDRDLRTVYSIEDCTKLLTNFKIVYNNTLVF